MGEYSAAFKAYLDGFQVRLYPVLRIAWPNGDIERLSWSAISTPDGQYEDRVVQGGFEDVAESVDPRTPGLSSLSTRVTVRDDDRRLMKRLEGATDCRNAPATIYWASPDLALADWSARFTGIFATASYQNETDVVLNLRTDERWLTDSQVPRFPLSKGDAGDVPDASVGIYLPTILGSYDGQNLSAQGFVPAIRVRYVAGALCWDLVMHGVARSVPRVYLGSTFTLKTAGVDYDVSTQLLGGKACTVIIWRAGHIPAAADLVQCDVEGLTNDGTTDGALITNPVAAFRKWLINYAWGAWKSGASLSEAGAPLDGESWAAAEALATTFKLEGSKRIGGTTSQRRPIDEFNEVLETWQMFRPHWLPSGKLALDYLDTAWPGYGAGDAFDLVRQGAAGVGRPKITDDDSGLCSRVSLQHLFDAIGSKSWGSLDVEDLTVSEKATANVRMTASAARF